VLGPRPAAPRRDHPGERPEDDREQRPERDHRERVRDRNAQVLAHRLRVLERDAHVPVRELLQVDQELLALRLVEPELPRDRLPRLRGGMGHAREVRDRASGREPEEREVQDQRDEDRDDRERDSLEDVVGAAQRFLSSSGAPS
jgi:hypothetical protein